MAKKTTKTTKVRVKTSGAKTLKLAKPIPAGFHTVSPYLTVPDAEAVVAFVKAAFHAKELHRSTSPSGGLHVQLKVGDSMVMIGGPSKGDFKAMLYLYVPDCDAVYEQAVAAGGKSIMPPTDMPYGDRHGAVEDPAGNQWYMATRIADVV
jgi:uncharacterized glyoxalase superfamily protein PhnB